MSEQVRFQTWMKEELGELEIALTDQQLEQFYHYYELLVEWNKVMNLTAITEMEDVVTKHFVDSLSLVKAVKDLETAEYRILDLGTGAGFPGIPLKIAFPNLQITLLDSLNKRIKFLNEVISQLGLRKIEAIHGRAEDYGRDKEYRETYDFCVSRAVANLATLSEYCMPYVKIGGVFVPYKSGKLEEELVQAKGAVKLLGGKVEDVIAFTLPKADADRTFVVIRKMEGTSRKYPRKAGLPSKEPLK
ncbi:MAG: 16S rRNA (guanine(527)-N(7))-methyltransferase RsmG [Hungatella sp.]